MSEFKFACPVCGQHITAAAGAVGTRIDCPTCFRKIVVPQAPASADSKLILSASEADPSRPATSVSEVKLPPRPKPTAIPAVALALVVLGAAGVAGLMFRDELFSRGSENPEPQRPPATTVVKKKTEPVRYPVPTNVVWDLNIARAKIPETPVQGRIHGQGFRLQSSSMTGGSLTLRQGSGWPPDLALSIRLTARHATELSGKSYTVQSSRQSAPRVTMRWKDGQGKAVTENITNGYALRLVFDKVTATHIPGRLYIALPDADRSVLAGTFEAVLRTNPPPKKASGPSSAESVK